MRPPGPGQEPQPGQGAGRRPSLSLGHMPAGWGSLPECGSWRTLRRTGTLREGRAEAEVASEAMVLRSAACALRGPVRCCPRPGPVPPPRAAAWPFLRPVPSHVAGASGHSLAFLAGLRSSLNLGGERGKPRSPHTSVVLTVLLNSGVARPRCKMRLQGTRPGRKLGGSLASPRIAASCCGRRGFTAGSPTSQLGDRGRRPRLAPCRPGVTERSPEASHGGAQRGEEQGRAAGTSIHGASAARRACGLGVPAARARSSSQVGERAVCRRGSSAKVDAGPGAGRVARLCPASAALPWGAHGKWRTVS